MVKPQTVTNAEHPHDPDASISVTEVAAAEKPGLEMAAESITKTDLQDESCAAFGMDENSATTIILSSEIPSAVPSQLGT